MTWAIWLSSRLWRVYILGHEHAHRRSGTDGDPSLPADAEPVAERGGFSGGGGWGAGVSGEGWDSGDADGRSETAGGGFDAGGVEGAVEAVAGSLNRNAGASEEVGRVGKPAIEGD